MATKKKWTGFLTIANIRQRGYADMQVIYGPFASLTAAERMTKEVVGRGHDVYVARIVESHKGKR